MSRLLTTLGSSRRGAGGGGGGGGGSNRYYRLLITAINGGSRIQLADLELRGVADGASVAVGGTPSASSELMAAYDAAKAFDGDPATEWLSDGLNLPEWLQYDFGAGNEKAIVQYALVASPGGGPTVAPADFKLQASADGSTWADLDERTGETNWVNGEVRVYTL